MTTTGIVALMICTFIAILLVLMIASAGMHHHPDNDNTDES